MRGHVVIVYTPVGGGHKAAALALCEAAERRGHSVEVLDLFEWAPAIVGAAYQTAHLRGTSLTPTLYGKGYFAANHRHGALDPIRRSFDHLAFAKLVNRVRVSNPHAVIGTHHLPLVVLGRARELGWLNAPLTGVVTDYTAHACWAEQGVDSFCVAGALAGRELAGHGVADDRIIETGIPVRAEFEEVPLLTAPLPGEPLRVLLTSGTFGVGPTGEVIGSFAGIADLELTVVCGGARGATEQARRAAEGAGVRARIIGFEEDMVARVNEAHIIIGKAGGLTVTETMTAARPMILVGTVPGNELANERLVVEGGAGYAARPKDAGSLANALRNRGALVAMGRNARALVTTHAAERVLDVAMQRMGDWVSAAA